MNIVSSTRMKSDAGEASGKVVKRRRVVVVRKIIFESILSIASRRVHRKSSALEKSRMYLFFGRPLDEG